MHALLLRCCAGTSIEPDGALGVADCRLPAPGAAGGARAAPVLRTADELWWLAAERALMLPLEYARTASRLLGSEIELLRALSAPPPGRGSDACPGCDEA